LDPSTSECVGTWFFQNAKNANPATQCHIPEDQNHQHGDSLLACGRDM